MHQCQLYDRAYRVKQCFRCYHYGHIGTQCNASQTCGYCAELHETKQCRRKSEEGFSPRCTVCKGGHTGWSNACPARKKETERVERAKQVRSIYWHVPAKASTTRPSENHMTNTNPNTIHAIAQPRNAGPPPNTQTEMAIQRVQEPTETMIVQLEPPTHPPPPEEHVHTVTEGLIMAQQSTEAVVVQTTEIPSVGEEWATPATQQESAQPQLDPSIDPRLMQEALPTEELSKAYPPLPSTQTTSALEDTFEAQNAGIWLDNMFNDDDNEWLPDTPHAELSPVTSEATEPRTTTTTIFKGCNCPEHQHIYDNWPVRNAELTIAKCMTVCVYCGVDYHRPPTLRQHLKAAKHAQNNISVVRETMGRGSSITPSWTLKPRTGATSRTRTTRRSPATNTNSANAIPDVW